VHERQAIGPPATLRALEPLRIGIDARAAAEVAAGRGRFVREILLALAEREDRDVRFVCYARSTWGELPEPRFQWRLPAARDPWWHVLAARDANRRCDVFLSTNSYLTAWLLRIPAVCVVYDMVAFDRAHQPNRRSAVIERATLGIAVRRSAAFVAISEATAEDFVCRFPRGAGKVTVAPLGVSRRLSERPADAATPGSSPVEAGLSAPDAREPRPQLPEPGFVLAVGTLEPRKNLPRLVEAYARLDERLQRAHPLVVVGDLGWRTGQTLAALESLGERCLALGKVADAELAELYRRCDVFCYPSLYEGFGLPVLEAMAAGAAVLTSNVSSLPEVGGEAVAYADPLDTDQIAGGLRRLLEDPALRAELGAAARERAARFTWARTAERVLEVLRRAAA
jgi:glycosyltransferase involved in cell wall biosynthesis